MTEDFDNSLFKYNWHKNKHTLRYKNTNWMFCKNYKLECHRFNKKDVIPVTKMNILMKNLFSLLVNIT